MNPKPGEIWQHFKGTNYHILGVSGLLLIPDYPPHYWAKHTETGETLAVYHHIESESDLTLTKGDGLTVISEPHVLYFGSTDVGLVWARPLNNFLSSVICQDGVKLRFKKVSGLPNTTSIPNFCPVQSGFAIVIFYSYKIINF